MKRLINLTMTVLAAMAMLSACEEPAPEIKAEISASPSTVTFIADGETKNVAVTTNIEEWTYSGQPEWITVSVNGNELSLAAAANPTLEERKGSVVLSAKEASFTIELVQEKGSKHPGYEEMAVCEAAYIGSLYQIFMPDCEGGDATMRLVSEDERTEIAIEFFTPLYETAEEVVLPVGKYELGDSYSDFQMMNLEGKPQTFVGGGSYVISDEEGDEEFSGGSMIVYTIGDNSDVRYITGGSFTISVDDNGIYTVKTDFKDNEGNDLKYYYEGELEFDASEAMFPAVGEVDPTNIIAASCTFNGDSGFETTYLTLTLIAESEAITNIGFYVEQTDFENLVIEGVYSTPEGENDGSAGSMDRGSLLEMEGFSFPMGSYIMFTFGEYFIPDGESMLMITKNEDGTYTVIANLQNTDEADEGWMIMAENIDIELIDGTAYDDEEEW